MPSNNEAALGLCLTCCSECFRSKVTVWITRCRFAFILSHDKRGLPDVHPENIRNQMKSILSGIKFGDSYTCSYCLRVIQWDHHRTRPTRDHFFPKSKRKLLLGIKTSFVICCQPCNSRKSDKVFSSIEAVREFIACGK